ncbi:MAG: hypothetical protein ACJ763_20200 [Bdellovibrionia bacterium]
MNRLRSFVLALTALTVSFPQYATAGRKVAIVVDGGDDRNLKSNFAHSAYLTSMSYYKKGYEVIQFRASPGDNAEKLRKLIADQVGVDRLDIHIYSHGTVYQADKSSPLEGDPGRFPRSYLRQDELSSQLTDNEEVNGPVRFAYAFVPSTENVEFFGLGDLRKSLLEYKTKNPNGRVNLNTLSCFGGNAIRAVSDIPGVQVFSSTSGSQVGLVSIHYEKPSDPEAYKGVPSAIEQKNCDNRPECLQLNHSNSYLLYLNKELEKGMSFLDAHSNARKHYQEGTLALFDVMKSSVYNSERAKQYLILPQSSFDLTLADYCLGPPERNEIVSPCNAFVSQAPDVLSLATKATHFAVFEYARSELDSQSRYLRTIESFVGCNDENVKRVEKLMDEALEKSKSEVIAAIHALTPTEINTQIENLNAEIKKIRHARSNEDLVSWFGELTRPKDYGYKSNIETLIRYRQDEIKDLKRPLSEIQKSKLEWVAGISFKRCMREPDPAVCRPVLRKNTWLMLSRLRKDAVENDPQEKAINLLEGPCSVSKISSQIQTAGPELGETQFECLVEKTKDEPEVRIEALMSLSLPLSTRERQKTCDLIKAEISNRDKIKSCVSRPGGIDNPQLMNRLQSLFLQGGSTQ